MEPPFFNSHYQTPTPLQFRRTPVNKQPTPPSAAPSSRRKVISIPIHYVNSGRNRSDAALSIQKVFRGFRVRKPVKKILELKREVDAVEKKLQEGETMAAIRKDKMERLKVNEGLMGLLFKLDSVRGFNDEIRAFRKVVIRKVILLQELIDSAIDDGSDVMEEKESVEIADETGEIVDNCKQDDEVLEKSDEVLEKSDEVLEKSDEVIEDCTQILDDSTVTNAENSPTEIDETLENNSEEIFEDANNYTENLDDLSKMQVEDSEKSKEDFEVMQVETVTGSDDTWECVSQETEEQNEQNPKEDDHGDAKDSEEGMNLTVMEKETPPSKEDWFVVGGEEEEKRKKDKLLEKMAEDNEKLVAMVADLCQRNIVQSRLILSLSQRVDQLEKAMNDRLRKKKKKSNATIQV